ncbi:MULTISPECIES: polysaccharide deacetylase family protein [unclassified Sporosarcina]|uniref:polysaccharide deacetylase family protein n=1 Tax=unclassified Sporosarcina TaxID=2647733 RepID=UPI002040851C|nr:MULTISPECIES: polysaccharide deacetylase family protein [unclassified Sporosarcina]GKV65410.1 peptidoglycan-N-acetylmuramic acid deacetylase PdaC [Sporosarcina sp. NCCP-2331]GLB55534.1 peptidoglycan-N-acetylmuramic acid deacetylase PdaC [Sporosarcina sp. NCCP-2378]
MKKTHRKRRSLWIDVTLSIIIIALTVSAISLITLTTKGEAALFPKNKQDVTPAPVAVDAADSNYPDIKVITETSNDLYTPFTIQYPQSFHSSINEAISSYIEDAKHNYLTKHNGSKFKNELKISYEILSHRSGNYSFVLVNNSKTGKTIRETKIRSFHLNLESGEVFAISDVLGHNLKHLKTLSNLVREAIYNNPVIEDYLTPGSVHTKTEPTWDNFDNFAITDESLIFYFDEYVHAAGTVGSPVVVIPLNDINNLLTDKFKSVLQDTDENAIAKAPVKETITPLNQGDSNGDIAENEETKEENAKDVKKVALTFDDGPHPKVTRQILDTLKKYNAKATFFMLGNMVEKYPEIAREVQTAGHELGNHTWNHIDLTKLGAEKARHEINRTSAIIENVTGQKATEFRPPYGAVNETVRNQTNLPVVLWDVDTLDWKARDSNQLLANIKSAARDGSTILMHDIHQATADGLEAVLSYLQSEGYSFVKISDL